MQFKTIKDAVLIVLIFILGASISMGSRLSKELRQAEKENRQIIIKYKKIIKDQQLARIEEAKLRKEERKIDSIALAKALYFKKQDSLIKVREIKYLMKELEKYSNTQLDSILISEYEKATGNSIR